MAAMETKKKFTLDVGWAFTATIIPMAIGFLLRIFFGDYLGASGLGLYSLALIIYTMVTLIGALGIPSATVKYVAEYKEKLDKLDSFITCSIINTLIFGLISGLILYLLSGPIALFFHKPELAILLQILSFGIPFFILINTITRLFNGLRKMGFYSISLVIRSSFILIFSVLLIFMDMGVIGAVIAIVIAEILTTIIVTILSLRLFSFKLVEYKKETRTLLTFGVQLILADGAYFLDTNIDTMIVGYFLTSSSVGIYSIVIMFASLLFIIPGAIAQVTYPLLSELYAKKLKDAMQTTIKKSTRYAFAVTSVLGLGLILFSSDLITLLLPPVFQQAVIPLSIIVFALMLYVPFTSIGSTWNAVGKPHITFILGFTFVAINAAINIGLVPIYGILGAAIATSTTYIIRPFPEFYLWKKILDIKINRWWYLKPWLILGLLIGLFFYLQTFTNSPIIKIIILIVWLAFLSLVLLSDDEKKEIIGLSKHLIENKLVMNNKNNEV